MSDVSIHLPSGPFEGDFLSEGSSALIVVRTETPLLTLHIAGAGVRAVESARQLAAALTQAAERLESHLAAALPAEPAAGEQR